MINDNRRNGLRLTVVLMVTTACAIALGGCAKPAEQAVTGRLVIGDERGYTGTSSCSGVDPIAFYKQGYKLRMQEGTGDQAKPIATATFSDGSVTPQGCEFEFEFKVRPGFDQYTVLACEPGQARADCTNYGFTWDEMRDQDFQFDWCIACSGSALNGGSAVDSRGNSLTD